MGRVVFDHVTKRFGDVMAVADLSLEVHDKEFLVLLGPSGCGKSTALRLVAFQMGGSVCLRRDEAGRWAVGWMVVPSIL